MKTIYFVTTNSGKLAVARAYIEQAGLQDKYIVEQLSIETPEIQDDSVEKIALESARWASTKENKAVICADAGMELVAVKGFPGPYVKYFNQTFTVDQVMRLFSAEDDRTAVWTDALAFYDAEDGSSVVFRSDTNGKIALVPSTKKDASTVDRLFVPEGFEVPLADMSDEERMRAWNTSRWQKMLEYLASKN